MKLGTFQQSVGLFVAILIFFATAGPGGLVTTPQIPGWYAGLAGVSFAAVLNFTIWRLNT